MKDKEKMRNYHRLEENTTTNCNEGGCGTEKNIRGKTGDTAIKSVV